MNLQQFTDLYVRLAIVLRGDADAPAISAYYALLKDVPLVFLTMAAERIAKSSEWFPKPVQWGEMAECIERERQDDQRRLLRAIAPRRLCAECDDTGWITHTPANGPATVSKCPCHILRRAELL